MRRNPIVRPEAEADLAEAYAWYEERGVGLGSRFLVEVKATLDRMLQGPYRFPAVRKTVRRALVPRFPYAVYFIVADETVTVLAVLHQSRNPRLLVSRTPK